MIILGTSYVSPSTGMQPLRTSNEQSTTRLEHGLAIAQAWCRTRERQERALEILQFKLDVLWTMLDSIERAYPDDLPEEQRP